MTPRSPALVLATLAAALFVWSGCNGLLGVDEPTVVTETDAGAADRAIAPTSCDAEPSAATCAGKPCGTCCTPDDVATTCLGKCNTTAINNCGQSVVCPNTCAPTALCGADDGAPTACAKVFASCAEAKTSLKTTKNGVHWIDPDGPDAKYKPFRVYCAGMETASPKEYLELVNQSSMDLFTSNYSTYATGIAHNQWTCDCGRVTRIFSKIRVVPQTLVVVISDTTYAPFSADTNGACVASDATCPQGLPFAWAGSCVGAGDQSGVANVDLRGLPFHLAGGGKDMFGPQGVSCTGSAVIDDTGKYVELRGGGDCCNWMPTSGLRLEQDP